jgi:hypothetical protein
MTPPSFAGFAVFAVFTGAVFFAAGVFAAVFRVAM